MRVVWAPSCGTGDQRGSRPIHNSFSRIRRSAIPQLDVDISGGSGLPPLSRGGVEPGARWGLDGHVAAEPEEADAGYLLGALMTSITLGLVIVFALKGSSAVSTTENTLNPAVDLALGAIMLIAAFVLGTGRDKRISERRRARKGPKPYKGPPRWQQALSKGSARTTFASVPCSPFPAPRTWPGSIRSRNRS
jgi:hypothetical protein